MLWSIFGPVTVEFVEAKIREKRLFSQLVTAAFLSYALISYIAITFKKDFFCVHMCAMYVHYMCSVPVKVRRGCWNS